MFLSTSKERSGEVEWSKLPTRSEDQKKKYIFAKWKIIMVSQTTFFLQNQDTETVLKGGSITGSF